MRLLTIPQTAERLGCSKKHVYNLISAGKLKPANIALGPRSRTRIADTEIDRYITAATRDVSFGGAA
jgi:excisionase family DNA binding protein